MKFRKPLIVMNLISRSPKNPVLLAWVMCSATLLMPSCGVVGPPLPPEDIGIEAKIRAQKKAQENTTENTETNPVPLDQEEVSLPPLQRLGTQ